ncbi:MAG TPA: universal stress protein [Actinospica sp.]|nr:universal stress protein [Actinospica sp.]
MPELKKSVIVAVDGSAFAETAADWAAGEAMRRGTPLRVVSAVDAAQESGDEVADQLMETEARLAKAYPELVVERELLIGEPVRELEAVSREAAVLVVGSRGHGGFAGLAIGSVSMYLAMHARCPIVVVPQGHRAAAHSGPTVVGVDSHGNIHVLRYAIDHADRIGGRLRVVHAWNPYPAHSATYVSDTDITARQAQERIGERLHAAQAAMRQRPEISVLRGRPAEVLVEQSAQAGLIVVGSHHGWLALPGAVGPVLHELLLHARCPVAVIPVQ